MTHGSVTLAGPNPHIYNLDGTIKLSDGKPIPIDVSNSALQGTMLKNTEWAIGVVGKLFQFLYGFFVSFVFGLKKTKRIEEILCCFFPFVVSTLYFLKKRNLKEENTQTRTVQRN